MASWHHAACACTVRVHFHVTLHISDTLAITPSMQVVVDDLRTLFCSKLVAASYKAVGLLAPNRKASDFLPKHFDAAHAGFLRLREGVSLGPHVPVTIGATGLQESLTAILSTAVNGIGDVVDSAVALPAGLIALLAVTREDRAALTVQRVARGMLARLKCRRWREHSAHEIAAGRGGSGGAETDAERAQVALLFEEVSKGEHARTVGLQGQLDEFYAGPSTHTYTHIQPVLDVGTLAEPPALHLATVTDSGSGASGHVTPVRLSRGMKGSGSLKRLVDVAPSLQLGSQSADEAIEVIWEHHNQIA